jgi:hypothetical protein
MSDVFHVVIKKEYAASLIKHLKKEDAIDIIEENPGPIPEWQKEAVRKTLAEMQAHPEQLQPWEIVKQKYKQP